MQTIWKELLMCNQSTILCILFCICEVFYIIEQVYTSNGLYADKAFMSTEFSFTKGTKESLGFCNGYSYGKDPKDFSKEPFDMRKLTAGHDEVSLYGKLAPDVFTCDMFLLPNVSVRIRLVRSWTNFYIIAGDDTIQYRAKITEASLFTRQVAINDNAWKLIRKSIQHQPARYTFSEMLSKTLSQ